MSTIPYGPCHTTSYEVIDLALLDAAYPDGARVVEESMRCRTCDKPLAGHKRCGGCSILVGPGHEEPYTIDGLCETCHDWAQRKRGVRS